MGWFVESTYLTGSLADHYSVSRDFVPESIKPGDVVYARHFLHFFPKMHDRIAVPYVLLSTYHDRAVEPDSPGVAELDQDDRIIEWFSVNVAHSHPKLRPLPLGLNVGGSSLLDSRGTPKTNWLYMNFSLNTKERIELWERFQDQEYCVTASHDKRKFNSYGQGVASSRFVLSPPGLGLDCFRTWEALAAGSVPIVRKAGLNLDLYSELPVMIVDSWSDVTLERLQDFWSTVKVEDFNSELLTNEYWASQIKGAYSRKINA